MPKMVSWLDDFATSYSKSKSTKKMTKKASAPLIIDKKRFPKAANGDIISFSNKKYRVINASYKDEKGTGILIERCADLIGDPMEVATGTSADYTEGNTDAGVQEYANVDPEIQDEDPRDDEVAKFEAEAEETEAAIAAEDAIDGTSGATRPNRIIQKILDTYAPAPAEEATDITDEINEEVAYDESIVDDTEDVEFADDVEFVDEDLEYDEESEDDEFEDEESEDEEFEDEDEDEVEASRKSSRKVASRIQRKFRDLRK